MTRNRRPDKYVHAKDQAREQNKPNQTSNALLLPIRTVNVGLEMVDNLLALQLLRRRRVALHMLVTGYWM
jgi:hypothetical protein